jgi:tetraacyldisaccharide 4'-kinase
MLGLIYSTAARARRRVSRRAGMQRRLQRPVVSVGNLCVGGTGKTPTVAYLAHLLIEMGERPSILSRGYARAVARAGVVVVSDGQRVCAGLDQSGDEPMLLAGAVPGAAVLVSPDRYLAGRLAELHLGATVHLLDDGFQHLPLWRGTDLLIVTPDDVANPRTLPIGRLREPISAAVAAHALLVADASDDEAADVKAAVPVEHLFRLSREPGQVQQWHAAGAVAATPAAWNKVFAVAGIARPARFFAELAASGWDIAGTADFADHYRYRPRDIAGMVAAARACGASAIVTTEKDLMRLRPFAPFPMPLCFVPLHVRIEPADAFRRWLAERLADERAGRSEARA